MPHAAFYILLAEHRALRMVLRSLTLLLARYRCRDEEPDFALLRAMIFYIDEVPERLHHRTESELLFPWLRGRCPELAPVLDRLDADHATGAEAIHRLQRALLSYEMMGESRRDAFELEARRYAEFYLQHMRIEEQQVMPVAAARLAEADWSALDDAFEKHRDPLVARSAGAEPDSRYFALFRRILLQAPTPIGLGATRSA